MLSGCIQVHNNYVFNTALTVALTEPNDVTCTDEPKIRPPAFSFSAYTSIYSSYKDSNVALVSEERSGTD